MIKEEKFYKALQDVFIGARIEGEGGFINLMKIKSNYYSQIEKLLKEDIEKALEKHFDFRNELFDKLHSFFSRYFTESGSIYFNSTPFHNNIYEKVYTDEKDVILFWKTQMLYYVKTDRIFRSMPVEIDLPAEASAQAGGLKFYFDASKMENKKANEKRSLIFEMDKVREDRTIVFAVAYSERGRITKQDEILKALKQKGITIKEEQLEKAFRVFEKQSEVDFFINKNARAFLEEQFKLWSYQYFWDGAKEWGANRVNELQILKQIAFKIIDFISQFEDELVKIWNKPKFVRNSNYVITLDRILSACHSCEGRNPESLVEKIFKAEGIKDQIKEWQELGIVDKSFKTKDAIEDKKFEHLPIDTKYFKELELEILDLFDDLDNQLDGWLIKSENYQALNTILPKFKEKVQTIYIDPPFNTNSSPIIYINNYKHSSWLSMMENRFSISKDFLKPDGINITAIDDVELRYLIGLQDEVFEKENYITTIASECNPQGRVANKVSQTSEYHIVHAKNIDNIDKLSIKKLEYRKPSPLKRTGTNSRREERPNRYYPILLKNNKIFMISNDEYLKIYDKRTKNFNDKFVSELETKYIKEGFKFILPKGENGEKFVWQRIFDRVLSEKETYIVKDENIYTPSFEMEIPKTFWKNPLYSNPEYGSEYLTNMLGHSEFETPKSYHTIMQFLLMAGGEGIYLDYFGGSGTTAQSVIEMKKSDDENGNDKKYLVIEMGDHFDSVILPRIKKICVSNKWKNGKPLDFNGVPQIFKYYELEQYEETLANCKYQDGDLFNKKSEKAYQDYVFMKDEKMLSALEIDYKNNKVKVDLTKLYPNIDIAETLSNLTGKWIKKISSDEVEFADGTKINTKNLDYKIIKPLIWWE
ncbi:MAG: DNA methyltransferase [Elusimicrobiota bacterium]